MKARKTKISLLIPIIAAAVILAAIGAFVYALRGLKDFYKEDIEEEKKVQELIDLVITTTPPKDASADETRTRSPAVETETAPVLTPGVTDMVSDDPADAPNDTEVPMTSEPAAPTPAETSAATDKTFETAVPAETAPMPTESAAPTSTPPENDGPQSPLILNFDMLSNINSDICAWLYNEGTAINYPVVYSRDNIYYLSHNYKKEHSNGGALFVDYRNNRDFSDVNTIIYGHYMRSGTMFGSLASYKNQSYYNKHPYMWLYTPYGSYRLDLIAGYVTTPADDAYTIFGTTEQMQAFLAGAVQHSTFRSGYDITRVTQTVVLSTCSYEYQNARFVVIGSLVRIG